MKQLLNSL